MIAIRKWSVVSALVAGVWLLLAGVKAQQPAPPRAYVADEILVKFSSSTNANQRDNMLRARSAARIRRFAGGIDHLRLPQGLSVDAAIAAFRAMPGVEAAAPNYIRHIIQNSAPPNDPFWLDGSLWGLEKIQAPAAWSNFTAGDGSVDRRRASTPASTTPTRISPPTCGATRSRFPATGSTTTATATWTTSTASTR